MAVNYGLSKRVNARVGPKFRYLALDRTPKNLTAFTISLRLFPEAGGAAISTDTWSGDATGVIDLQQTNFAAVAAGRYRYNLDLVPASGPRIEFAFGICTVEPESSGSVQGSPVTLEFTDGADGIDFIEVTATVSVDGGGAIDLGAGTDGEVVSTNAAGALLQRAGRTIAQLLARANHTGTQLAATISDFASAVGTLIGAHSSSSDPHGDRAFSIQRANHTGTQALSTLAASGATTGQLARFNGTTWAPATVSGGGSGSPIETAGPLVIENIEDPAPLEGGSVVEFRLGGQLLGSVCNQYYRLTFLNGLNFSGSEFTTHFCQQAPGFPTLELRTQGVGIGGSLTGYDAGSAFHAAGNAKYWQIDPVDFGSSNGGLKVSTLVGGSLAEQFTIARAQYGGQLSLLELVNPANGRRYVAQLRSESPDFAGMANLQNFLPYAALKEASGTARSFPGDPVTRIGAFSKDSGVDAPVISPDGRKIRSSGNTQRLSSTTVTMAGDTMTLAFLIARFDTSLALALECSGAATSTPGTWDVSVNGVSGEPVRFNLFRSGFSPISIPSPVGAYTAVVIRIESGQPTALFVNGVKSLASTPTGGLIDDTMTMFHRTGAGFSCPIDLLGFITTTALSDVQCYDVSRWLMQQV